MNARAKKILLIALLVIGGIGLSGTVAQERETPEDPCKGNIPPGGIGLVYDGKHCILVEPERGPVQGPFSARIEDLDGIRMEGIIVAHTKDGWRILDEEWVWDQEGWFATVEVGSGYHIEADEVLDPEDAEG